MRNRPKGRHRASTLPTRVLVEGAPIIGARFDYSRPAEDESHTVLGPNASAPLTGRILGRNVSRSLWGLAMRFNRITVHPDQMGGVPCVRGLRIPVATVVGLVAQGMSADDILAEYPDLEIEDVREVLRFAAAAVEERQLPLAASA